MEYRLMTPEDHGACYALWLDTPGMGLKDLDDGPEGFARFLRRNPTSCFVALDGDRVVGTVLAGHDGRRGAMHHMAVARSHRRQGIATRLLELAIAALEQEGIHKVHLVVFARNADGNAFWEARGFGLRDDILIRDKSIHEMKQINT